MTKINFDLQMLDICNLHCKFCIMGNTLHRGKKTNIDAIIESMKQCLSPGDTVDYVYFNGGEPGLGDLDGMMKIMDTFPTGRYKIVTNLCYPLTEKHLELYDRIESLQTSFDIGTRFGNVRNLNRWYHNCKWILNNLRSDLGVMVTLNSSTLKRDPKDLSHLFNKIGFSEYTFYNLCELGSVNDNREVVDTKENIKQFLMKSIKLRDPINNTTNIIKNKMFQGMCFKWGWNYEIASDKPLYTNTKAITCTGEIVNCSVQEHYYDTCCGNPRCFSCKFYKKKCGGSCIDKPCLFDEELYDMVMKEY